MRPALSLWLMAMRESRATKSRAVGMAQPTPWARFTMLTGTDLPVVLTSTNVDTRIVGRDSHRGKDLVELTRFTKWSCEFHRADRIPEILNRAFKVASTPPTGPVYLSLPSNLLGESISVQNPDVERSRVVTHGGVIQMH